MPLPASAGTIGRVPPVRISAGRRPSDALERVEAELDRLRIGRDEARRRRRPQLDLELRARRSSRSRSSRSTSGAISSTFWPGASRIETFATASTGSTVFCRYGEPLAIPFTSSAGSANVRR